MDTPAPKRQAPPYIAYQTLKTLVGNMKQHGVPGRIDRSVLGNFSGAVGGQLMTALKFLDLTDKDGHPSPLLARLVEAYGSEDWGPKLAEILKRAFAPVFQLNLETATAGQFNERFAQSFEGEGDTLRKAITFFVNAVRDAQIPISVYILKNKKPRAVPTKKRSPRATGKSSNGSVKDPPPPPPPPPPADGVAKPMEYQLLDLMKDGMSDDERSAVWTLINYLKRQNAA
jgi:hypothetical protein